MTWEELCKKAKELGWELWISVGSGRESLMKDLGDFQHLDFDKNGEVSVVDEGCYISLAKNRTPEQMWKIMGALK